MDLGFFVHIKKIKRKGVSDQIWSATAVDMFQGWRATEADSIEGTLSLQRGIYMDRCAEKKEVPALVQSSETPMATGKMMRFVTVHDRKPATADAL